MRQEILCIFEHVAYSEDNIYYKTKMFLNAIKSIMLPLSYNRVDYVMFRNSVAGFIIFYPEYHTTVQIFIRKNYLHVKIK